MSGRGRTPRFTLLRETHLTLHVHLGSVTVGGSHRQTRRFDPRVSTFCHSVVRVGCERTTDRYLPPDDSERFLKRRRDRRPDSATRHDWGLTTEVRSLFTTTASVTVYRTWKGRPVRGAQQVDPGTYPRVARHGRDLCVLLYLAGVSNDENGRCEVTGVGTKMLPGERQDVRGGSTDDVHLQDRDIAEGQTPLRSRKGTDSTGPGKTQNFFQGAKPKQTTRWVPS